MYSKKEIIVISLIIIILKQLLSGCNDTSSSTNGDTVILPDVKLNFDRDEVRLSEIISKDSVVVIYLSTLGCAPCAAKEIEILNDLPSDSQLIILGKFNSRREYKIFSEKVKFKVLRIHSNAKLFEDEHPRHNYIFLVDKGKYAYDITDISADSNESTKFYKVLLKGQNAQAMNR